MNFQIFMKNQVNFQSNFSCTVLNQNFNFSFIIFNQITFFINFNQISIQFFLYSFKLNFSNPFFMTSRNVYWKNFSTQFSLLQLSSKLFIHIFFIYFQFKFYSTQKVNPTEVKPLLNQNRSISGCVNFLSIFICIFNHPNKYLQ